ncbi:MAG: FtsQ-type POTRA domain-containing protein [Succinivibrio sp.]|nr:FtsQ-type POTRA domain-containing protein [Succinivibrio sp.]
MVRKGQSRGRFIAGVIFLITLIGLGIWGNSFLRSLLADPHILPVRSVRVDGVLTQLTKRGLAHIAGRKCAGKNIVTLDVEELTQALKQDPWVAQVMVKKKMPDTLVISVVEHVPAAYWNDNGLYDAKAQVVFYPNLRKFNEPLVKLGAFRDNLAPEVYKSAVAFIRVMEGSRFQLVQLYLDKVRCYTMTLQNGTRLILGRQPEVAEQRLKRFLESFDKTGLKINDLEYVDLRYDVGFAVGARQHEAGN